MAISKSPSQNHNRMPFQSPPSPERSEANFRQNDFRNGFSPLLMNLDGAEPRVRVNRWVDFIPYLLHTEFFVKALASPGKTTFNICKICTYLTNLRESKFHLILFQVLFSPDCEMTKHPDGKPETDFPLSSRLVEMNRTRIFLLHRIPASSVFVLAQDCAEQVFTVQADSQVCLIYLFFNFGIILISSKIVW